MSSHPDGRVLADPPTAAGVTHADDPDLDELRFAILARIRHTLAHVDDVVCYLDRRGPDVTVHLAGPAISDMRRHAIAVRVLDAVRSVGRTYGHVDVEYVDRSDDGRTA
jgi:hypothetical protein